MAGQQKGGEYPPPLQATDNLLFEGGWIRKPCFPYLADKIMKAPKVLIETIERGQDAQNNDCQDDPSLFFRRNNLSNEKENRRITDQLEKKITADCVVYGVKGIKNGQNKKGHKGKGESNPPDLQRPLFYPSIEPEKEGPTQEDDLYGRGPKEYVGGKKGGEKEGTYN